MDKEAGLTGTDRCCHIINAMAELEAKLSAQKAEANTSSFE